MGQSQDSTSFTIGGSLDAYFRSNLVGNYDVAPTTSFANLPGFALGMANLSASYYKKSSGIVVDLVAGPRGEDATFLSSVLRPGGNSSIINQLYVFVDLSSNIKVTLGNFNTFLGYEVISPTDNFNYSTSYMFSYGPFSHTGLKIDFDLGRGFSLMTGVFNPTDATEYNPSNDYAGGVQLGYAFNTGSVYLNSIISDDFYQVDLTAGIDLTDEFFVGANSTFVKDAFWGVAGYLQYAISSEFKLGTRVEYFKDNGVGAILENENVIDITLSGSYTVDNLTIIPEIRLDKVSAPSYLDDNTMKNSLASFVLAAVYGF